MNTGSSSTPFKGGNVPLVAINEIWKFFNLRGYQLSAAAIESLQNNPVSRKWALHEWEQARAHRSIDYTGLAKVADDGVARITRRIFNEYGEVRITFGEADDPVALVFTPHSGVALPQNAYLIAYRESDAAFAKIVLPNPSGNRYSFFLDSSSWELKLLCDRSSAVELMREASLVLSDPHEN